MFSMHRSSLGLQELALSSMEYNACPAWRDLAELMRPTFAVATGDLSRKIRLALDWTWTYQSGNHAGIGSTKEICRDPFYLASKQVYTICVHGCGLTI